MSLEAQISRLADAVEKNNALFAEHVNRSALPVPAAEEASAPPAEQEPVVTTGVDDAPDAAASEPVEVVWYHDPAKREVWSEEGPARRRKGIVKVAEATAQRLREQYAEEDGEPETDEAAEATADGDTGLDLGGDEDGDKFDESGPMDDDAWGVAWKDWGKAAIQHALDGGAEDREAAETEVKRFIVPLVKSFVGPKDKPQIAAIPATHRARFLNKAHDFFNS